MTKRNQRINISNCKNIHFNNYNFDYEIPSTVSGTIVSMDTRHMKAVIEIDDEFDLTDSNYNGGAITWGSYMEFVKDPASGSYYPDLSGNLLYNSTGDGIKNILNGSYDASTHQLTLTFRSKPAEAEKGKRVAICYTMYEYFGFYALNCENVYLESVNLYHTMGMAIGAGNCKNLYLNRVALALKEGSSRLVTATADGFHPYNTEGEIVITNCTFMNIIMGVINIFSTPGDIFAEGIMPGDAVVKNNKFIGCVGGDVNIYTQAASGRTTAGTIMNAEISNNAFCRSASNTVYTSGAGNVTNITNESNTMSEK